MKKIKGLLLFVITFILSLGIYVSNDLPIAKAAVTNSSTFEEIVAGTYSVVYSSSVIVNEDTILSESDIKAGDTVFISFYYKPANNVSTFNVAYEFSNSQFTSFKLFTSGTDFDDAYDDWASMGIDDSTDYDESWFEKYYGTGIRGTTNYTDNDGYYFLDASKMDFSTLGNISSTSSTTSILMGGSCAYALSLNNLTYPICIGKAWVTVATDATSIELDMYQFEVAGDDNNDVVSLHTEDAYPNAMKDISVSLGGASNVAELASGTVQGSADTSASNLAISGTTATGTVSPASTTAALSLTAADGGTIKSVKVAGSPITASSGLYNITLGSTGSTTSAVVTILAADNSTEADYTVTITRDKYDYNKLTSLSATNADTSITFAPTFTGATDGTVQSLTMNVAEACTSVKFTIGFDTTKNIKSISLAGQALTSAELSAGTATKTVTVSNGNSFTIAVTSEKGNVYNYTVNVVSSNLGVSSVTVYNQNGVSYGTATWSGTQYVLEMEYSRFDSSTYTVNTGAQFRIAASKSTNTVKYGPSKITIGSTTNTSTVSFDASEQALLTFYVIDSVTNEEKAYNIVVTRKAKSNDNSLIASGVSVKVNSTSYSGTFDGAGTTYTIVAANGIPRTDNSFDLTITAVDPKATVSINSAAATRSSASTSISFPTGSDSVTVNVIVYAEDGTQASYSIVVNKQPKSNDTSITGVVVKNTSNVELTDKSYDSTTSTYTINTKLKPEDNSVNVSLLGLGDKTWKIGTDATEYTSASTAFYTFDTVGTKKAMSHTITVTVIAEDGTTTFDYYIKIQREGADNTVTLDSVLVSDGSTNYTLTYDSASKTYKLDTDVPYTINDLIVTATATNASSLNDFAINGDHTASSGVPYTVTIGSASDVGEVTISIPIYVQAADYTSETYYVSGKRKAAEGIPSVSFDIFDSTDGASTSLDATLAGLKYTLNDVLAYVTEQLSIKVNLGNKTAYVLYDGIKYYDGDVIDYVIGASTVAINGTIDLPVYAQDTSTVEYSVDFSRHAPGTSKNFNISIVDGNNNSYDLTVNHDNFSITINDKVPYTVNELFITIDLDDSTTGIYYYATSGFETTKTPDNTAKTWTIGTSSDINEITLAHRFKLVPEYGETVSYSITGIREKANNDTSLVVVVSGYFTSDVYSISQSTSANNNTYTIPTSKDSQVKFDLSNPSGSSIYFSTEGYKINEINWTAINSNTGYDVGHTYYVRVQAVSTAEMFYQINIEAADERDGDATLKVLQVTEMKDGVTNILTPDATFVPESYAQTLKYVVPYSQTTLTVTATPTKSTSYVYSTLSKNPVVLSIDVSVLPVGVAQTFNYYVQAQNDSWSTDSSSNIAPYRIVIERSAGNSDAYIQNLKINGETVTGFTNDDKTGGVYLMILSRGRTSLPNPTYDVADKAEDTFSGSLTFVNGSLTFNIHVESEDKTRAYDYTVTVYSADSDFEIKDIQILDQDASTIITDSNGDYVVTTAVELKDEDNNLYYDYALGAASPITITVPYSIDEVFMYMTAKNANAKVHGNGTYSLTPGVPTTITVYVNSEYGEISGNADGRSDVYKFVITRAEPCPKNALESFEAYLGGTAIPAADISFNKNSSNIYISNIDGSTDATLTIVVTKECEHAKVNFVGSTNDQDLKHDIPLAWSSLSTDAVISTSIEVVSEGGASNPYTLTISRGAIQKNPDPSIEGIEIFDAQGNDYSPNIDTDTFPYTFTVDGSVDLVTVNVIKPINSNPTITITYVKPNGSTVIINKEYGFINLDTGVTKVNIKSVAEDNTHTVDYDIEITRPQSSDDASLKEIVIDGTTYSNPDHTLTVLFPENANNIPFVAVPNDINATVEVSLDTDGNGKLDTLKKGLNVVTINVTAPDNKTKDVYTVNVYIDEDTHLGNLIVKNHTLSPSFDPDTSEYNVTIGYDVDYVEVEYEFPAGTDASLLTVTGTGLVLTPSSKTIEVVVTPKTGATNARTYKINISKGVASDANLLLDLKVNGAAIPDFKPEINGPYVVLYPRNTSSITITDVQVSTDATPYLPNDLTLDIGCNDKEIVVEAQNGEKNIYNFTFIVADDQFTFSDMKLLNRDGTELEDLDGKIISYDQSTNTYEFRVANSVDIVKLSMTKAQFATVLINNEEQGYNSINFVSGLIDLPNVGMTTPNEIVVQIISEYKKEYPAAINSATTPFTIKIVREPLNGNADLKSLAVTVGDDSAPTAFKTAFVSTTYGPYIIEGVGNSTSIRIDAEPIVSTTDVYGKGTKQLTDGSSDTSDLKLTYTFEINTEAEDGTTRVYTVIVCRGAYDPDKDNTMGEIVVTDSKANTHLDLEHGFDPSNPGVYEVNVPVGAESYTIFGKIFQGSKATVYIETDGVVEASASKQVLIDSTNWGTTITHVVWAKSAEQVDGTKYTVKVNIAQPSTDNKLLSLSVDGTLVDGFDPEFKGPYIVNKNANVSTINVAAIANDKTSNIIGDGNDTDSTSWTYISDYTISSGNNNIFTVTVISQDGEARTYTIQVVKDYEDPYLITLGIVGANIYDANGDAFNKDVKEYFVTVPYSQSTVDVYATSEVPTDVINGLGIKSIDVGTTPLIVPVISIYGKTTSYKINVTRLPEESANSNAGLIELSYQNTSGAKVDIKDFNDNFNPYQLTYGLKDGYVVPNFVDTVAVNVATQYTGTIGTNQKASYEIFGNNNLHVGNNIIAVTITSADGSTQTTYVINVYKEDMNYSVVIDGNEYLFTEIKENEEYLINLGDLKTSTITDFTDFIEADEHLTVECLSDISTNPDEVFVRITDGEEEALVKFVIQSTTNNEKGADLMDYLPLLILLGVIVIVLITILICVNRDKYGRITRKSNKKNEKENKKADSR